VYVCVRESKRERESTWAGSLAQKRPIFAGLFCQKKTYALRHFLRKRPTKVFSSAVLQNKKLRLEGYIYI